MSRNLIDRDAFVEEMNKRVHSATQWGVNAIADRNYEIKIRAEQAVATFCEASLTAKKMPTVDAVEVVYGSWMRYGEHGEPNSIDTCIWQCDKCLETYYGRTERIPNYCPNCGAKMDVGSIGENK